MDEKLIASYMKKLGLTREEAIQLIKDDEDDVSVDLTPEQQKVVKKMTQGERKKEIVKRNRERKVDPDKLSLVTALVSALTTIGGMADALKNESEINFSYNGCGYTLRLIKHREKKA